MAHTAPDPTRRDPATHEVPTSFTAYTTTPTPVRALDLANGSADRDVATFENTS
jgi:hypothetical protein